MFIQAKSEDRHALKSMEILIWACEEIMADSRQYDLIMSSHLFSNTKDTYKAFFEELVADYRAMAPPLPK